MTKRKGLFDVVIDVRGLLEKKPSSNSTPLNTKNNLNQYAEHTAESILISKVLATVTRQMKVSGNRSRTIDDNVRHVEHFQNITRIQYIEI
ncbi:hypothetical protein ABEP71_11320 [Bacillus velezensis]|uniref:hypothetical protein n=1 Tax=Bacillus velezensis TaxID=492670 RepID=UPI00025B35E4|nr:MULTISPECIES: hypothetical protein [Bacillus]EIF14156.1 hypothetical protein MY7_2490 [Bacillus sp. 5B6]MEC0953895.1 hypothetical protein [Bacillus velezensis]MED3705607.1 hypothetical protein [Bacillus velezensis]